MNDDNDYSFFDLRNRPLELIVFIVSLIGVLSLGWLPFSYVF